MKNKMEVVLTELDQLKDKIRNGALFRVRDCSLCGVGLHYICFDGQQLIFQSHCNCVTYENFQKRDWSELDYFSGSVQLRNFLNEK